MSDICQHCGGTGTGTSFTRPQDPCLVCRGTGTAPAPKPDQPKRDAAWLHGVAERLNAHETAAWERMR